jgi:F0F1-type ATP synthase delta subunit
VKAQTTVKPSLIGGMSVRIGDIVYDGSIVKQLGLLKEHLQQDTVGKIGVRQ